MASIGALKPRFAPIEEEPDNSLPTYTANKITVLGKLVRADCSINLATGELYADDVLAEKAAEFSSANIAMEIDDMTDSAETEVFGSTATTETGGTGGELTDSSEDAAPAGGLTYIKKLKRNNATVYRAYYYPKVVAALGADNAQTKGSGITFGTSQMTFTAFRANSGAWRIRKLFDSLAAADAWCETKLGKTGS